VTDGGRESGLRLRLLLDEDTSKDLARALDADGHDVVRSVEHDDLGEGADDERVRAVAAREGRVLVTFDDHHTAAVDADGPPPRIFQLVEQRHPAHVQARLVASAVAYVDDLADLPPAVVIGDEYR
jgi:predicted nuclease of predicted toxin-antitoxin system